MEENFDQAEVSNQQEEEVLETSQEVEQLEQDSNESVEEYKARLAKAEELANNYRVRAERAERIAKAAKSNEVQKPTQTGELSTQDLYALMQANVPQEDIDDVREYATLKKISIADAIKAPIVKSILNEKAEERTVASAANVGSSKRGSGKIPDDVLLSRASKGELPENDADLERLVRLRKGLK